MNNSDTSYRQWLDSVYVVVLNWNLPHDTVECIQSLREDGLSDSQMLLVDNGSTDNSISCFETEIPDVPLLRLSENLGFAAGNNRGIAQLLGLENENVEWIFVLNNDTIILPETFQHLWLGLQSTDALIVSPLILHHPDYVDGYSNEIWSAGDIAIGNTLLSRPITIKNSAELPSVLPVDFLTACALLVHTSVFEKIGMFDENYFMYAEDADFCVRAKQRGINLACLPTSRIFHKVSKSTEFDSLQRRKLKLKNQILFYRKHATKPQLYLLHLFTLLRCMYLNLSDLFAPNWNQLIKQTYVSWWSGWTDSLESKT